MPPEYMQALALSLTLTLSAAQTLTVTLTLSVAFMSKSETRQCSNQSAYQLLTGLNAIHDNFEYFYDEISD